MGMCFLALAAAIDGAAALRHASALSALGPHPFGSPRSAAAAAYVAAGFRDAGLAEVRLQPFENGGQRGTNVLGLLRGTNPEFVVIGAHHDTAAASPGAYDGAGGVGVLIEVARTLSPAGSRPRTLVFASWDGEKARGAGSSAYVKSLGSDTRLLVAALAIDMGGWKDGAPTLHPIAYADPLRPGHTVAAPAWLVRTAADGSRAAREPFAIGDPMLGLFAQPVVRIFRASLFGDDLSFLQAGLPALMVADSSFTRFYPDSSQVGDTADKLDPGALARLGGGILGIVDALSGSARGPSAEPTWLAFGGFVLGPGALLTLALASLAPGTLLALRAKRLTLFARLAHAVLFTVFYWRAPVAAFSIFLLPNVLTPFLPRFWPLVTLVPAVAIAALGALAFFRSVSPEGPLVVGLWLQPWELIVASLALGLVFVRPREAAPRPRGKERLGKVRMRRR